MKKLILIFYFILSTSAFSAKLIIIPVSKNPILAYENSSAKVNIVGFVGGGGIKKGAGQSKNPLARDRKKFKKAGMNYYVFTNPKKGKKISLKYRKSKDHIKKISYLINYLKERNNLPIILVGHSRGSVSVISAAYALGKKNIKGIVLMGSMTAASSKVSSKYTIKSMLKKKLDVSVLIIHHKKDECLVTPYKPAKSVAEKYNFKLVTITGGGNSGRECGPLHSHGFEGTMPKVIKAIKSWSEE